MLETIIIIFLATLFYLAIANRMRNYIKILVYQGILLFLVAALHLKEFNVFNLVVILLETIVFKAIAVPYCIERIIRHNGITRETEPFLPHFVSLLITAGIVVGSILLSGSIEDIILDKFFFVGAVSAIFTGLYLIVSRRKILTHVVGYCVIENGVFILSLAVGNEMPAMVNLGVMLDIFASVFILGIFANKIGDVFHDVDIDSLSRLKD
ncbi:MAG: hypothetical protein KBS78_04075 [Bacteroidales bacterium]|nr:hypothetical protein [Candidatus Cryptobacteroides faecihippi]